MRGLLLRLFVKIYADTKDPAVRSQYGKLSGWVGIFCNILLFAGKGGEETQEIMGIRYEYDDVKTAEEAVEARKRGETD